MLSVLHVSSMLVPQDTLIIGDSDATKKNMQQGTEHPMQKACIVRLTCSSKQISLGHMKSANALFKRHCEIWRMHSSTSFASANSKRWDSGRKNVVIQGLKPRRKALEAFA